MRILLYMELQVYIAQLKDEEFDYDVENPNGDRQYAPEGIHWGFRLDELYWEIVHKVLNHEENTKQTDWGTFVIKLTNTELIEYLLKYVIKYKKYFEELPEGDSFKGTYERIYFAPTNQLLNWAKELSDGEYLLVAQELF